MTQYIGQITVILETGTSELASETLDFLARQLDDTHPEVVFADHNGEVEGYEQAERECGQSLAGQAKVPLLPVLLASLGKCAALLADYEGHPGEEGIAYREAIAAIAEAEAAGITPASADADVHATARRAAADRRHLERRGRAGNSPRPDRRPSLGGITGCRARSRCHDRHQLGRADCHADMLFGDAPETDAAGEA